MEKRQRIKLSRAVDTFQVTGIENMLSFSFSSPPVGIVHLSVNYEY